MPADETTARFFAPTVSGLVGAAAGSRPALAQWLEPLSALRSTMPRESAAAQRC